MLVRSRPGRYVGHADIEASAYAVDIPPAIDFEDHQERTNFIRENCRRDNWSNVATIKYDPGASYVSMIIARYLFLNQEDAMHFKMRFG